MKKVFKWLGIALGAAFFLIIAASVAVMLIVDKDMIDEQMENALNRQVSIGSIDVSVFSVVSGIQVKDVKISNFKTQPQREALKGKPVAANDLFVGLSSFTFKLKFLPLLKKQVELRELVLFEPVINVVRYPGGQFNFSDLLAPKKMTAEEKEELLKKEREEAKKKAEEAKQPQKPFTADDLPLEITIGKVGIEKGLISFVDQGLKQSFSVYNLTALVHSIQIDPKNLEKKNSVKLKIETGIKTIGQVQTGSVKSFDIGLSINGSVKPFDPKTKKVDPELSAKAGSGYGTMTGLQIFERLKEVEQLEKYCGKFAFLKDDIKWKNALVNVWYRGGTVKISDGRIATDDYELNFAGMTNINSKAVGMDMDMLLAEKHNKPIREGIARNVEKGIKAAKLEKYVKTEKVADSAMKALTNKEGKVFLQYKVSGTMSKPDVKLVAPKIPSIGDLIKDAAGDIKDVVQEKAEKKVEKVVDKQADKAKDKAAKKLKKLF